MMPYALMRDPRFLTFLGSFYATWTSADMTVDFAIGTFLNLPAETAQMLTAGMLYGAKIRVLRELVRKSNHKEKAKILKALSKIQNESKRNAFAHSYLVAQAEKVFFVERTSGGVYEVREHEYTLETWAAHVLSFAEAGKDLWEALGSPDDELQAFGMAAVNSVKKPKKPVRPSRGAPSA